MSGYALANVSWVDRMHARPMWISLVQALMLTAES